jgi:SAM-dependent methyltransferase
MQRRNLQILDVGACDINGNSRDIIATSSFSHLNHTYIGVDHIVCPNVDFVVDEEFENWDIAFQNISFNIVISTNSFEHDHFFWETFLRMSALLAPDGFLILIAPMRCLLHRHPVDSWRFQLDAPLSLQKWAQKKSMNVSLLYYDAIYTDVIDDIVSVYWKSNGGQEPNPFSGLSLEILVNLRKNDERRKALVSSYVQSLKDMSVFEKFPDIAESLSLPEELINQINCHYLTNYYERFMHRQFPFEENFPAILGASITKYTMGAGHCFTQLWIRYSSEDLASDEALLNATRAAGTYFRIFDQYPNFDVMVATNVKQAILGT